MRGVNRYSTIVAWMKVILPVLGIVLLSSLFLLSRSPDPDAAIPFADVDVVELVREQRLSEPRVAGTFDDGREVILVSRTARPLPDASNVLLLDQVEARVELSDTDLLFIDALSAEVDLAAQLADLSGAVQLRSTQGFQLDTGQLLIALDALRLRSPGDVVVLGSGVRIEAGAMSVEGPEAEAVVSFTDGVRVLYERQ